MKVMAECTGFKPVVSSVTGKRVNQATPTLRNLLWPTW